MGGEDPVGGLARGRKGYAEERCGRDMWKRDADGSVGETIKGVGESGKECGRLKEGVGESGKGCGRLERECGRGWKKAEKAGVWVWQFRQIVLTLFVF